MDTQLISLSPALIVEDDPATQRRLQRLLRELAGDDAQASVAGTLAAAKACLVTTAFDIVLVDIGLPDGSGIDLIAWLHAQQPQLPTLVISAWGDEATVLAALRAGAIGYLLKEREDIELSLSLKSIQRGGAPIDPAIARGILALLPPASAVASASDPSLSEREAEVLDLVARGYSNREIARLTTLSRFTIEGYTKSIYRKLAVTSRTEAVFEAKALGLLH